MFVMRRVSDVATAVVLQFCGAFAVWLLAERLHLSGILTMVAFAMAAARAAPEVTPARIRIPSYAVWDVAVFVLNVLAFILIGFQLKSVVGRLDRATWTQYAWVAAAVCAATILARIAWVSGAAAVSRWRCRPEAGRMSGPADPDPLSARAAAVVAWCGMRGTVTLAAALALPIAVQGGRSFPYRDLILFTSFAVVIVTLVLQGATLRPLILSLKLRDDGLVEREVRLARRETLRAALSAAASSPGAEAADLVRKRYELLLRRAETELASERTDAGEADAADARLIRVATAAERQRLSSLRADGTIGDAAFQRIEQELDLEELDLEQLLRTGDPP
jgi:CPA1 family monovalent cation:H+ antiporter